MSAGIVFAVYGSVIVVALAVLHFFRARRWYWHALSVLLALVIGLMPMPAGWNTPAHELSIGSVFLFLFVWGACAPLFPRHGHGGERHAPPHRA